MSKNLYVKITTIPQSEDVVGKELEMYFEKYRESNNLETLEDAKVDYYLNAGKNPLWGKIYSLTVGYEHNSSIRVSVLKGEEKDILLEFINVCNNDHFKGYQVPGWNFSFLLPFLRVRGAKHGINHAEFHKDVQDLGKKPWTMTELDIFDNWKGLGWFQSSLEETAELTFNIPTEFIDGKDIYNYFKQGKYDELDQSSINEIKTLINVHKCIKGENTLEDVVSNIKVLSKVQAVKLPVLERLYLANELTSEIKEELKQVIFDGKKKPTKKELENLFTIIRGVYVKTDFISGQNDSKKTIEQKELEIKELLGL